jgi:outer membrane receptor protein involved in Fe transport
LAPFRNYDFTYQVYRVGNPDLKTSNVHNMDLRFEFFPTRYDLISVGVFYKYFINPIEMVMSNSPIASAAGNRADLFANGVGGPWNARALPTMQFFNSKSAYNAGIEFEVRKGLRDLTNDPVLSKISVTANLGDTKSTITHPASTTHGRISKEAREAAGIGDRGRGDPARGRLSGPFGRGDDQQARVERHHARPAHARDSHRVEGPHGREQVARGSANDAHLSAGVKNEVVGG